MPDDHPHDAPGLAEAIEQRLLLAPERLKLLTERFSQAVAASEDPRQAVADLAYDLLGADEEAHFADCYQDAKRAVLDADPALPDDLVTGAALRLTRQHIAGHFSVHLHMAADPANQGFGQIVAHTGLQVTGEFLRWTDPIGF